MMMMRLRSFDLGRSGTSEQTNRTNRSYGLLISSVQVGSRILQMHVEFVRVDVIGGGNCNYYEFIGLEININDLE